MEGFIEQKVGTLRGMSRGSIIVLWICGLLFLSPVFLIAFMMLDNVFADTPVPVAVIVVLAVLLALGGLILFFAVKRGKQRKMLKTNPYAFMTVFGTTDTPQEVAKAFNTEARDGFNFEYANKWYFTDSYVLAVSGLGVEVAKLPAAIWAYFTENTTPNMISVSGKRVATTMDTSYYFYLYFAGSKTPLILAPDKGRDVGTIDTLLQSYDLSVSRNKELFKLADKDYAKFEQECLNNKQAQ